MLQKRKHMRLGGPLRLCSNNISFSPSHRGKRCFRLLLTFSGSSPIRFLVNRKFLQAVPLFCGLKVEEKGNLSADVYEFARLIR